MNNSDIIANYDYHIKAIEIVMSLTADFRIASDEIDEASYITTMDSLAKLRLQVISGLNTFRLGLSKQYPRM